MANKDCHVVDLLVN